jgi:hypothetical protein
MTAWSETKIARVLARNTFADDLCVLPNCIWTGYEADLLVVTRDCRLIDVEIKVSRADLRVDKHKDKWWRHPPSEWSPDLKKHVRPDKVARAWPPKVWKHYYALPAEIWRDELLKHVQPMSGVLLVHETQPRAPHAPRGHTECVKRAKPNREAKVINDVAVIAIARLASLRMWDAYASVERLNREVAAA